MQKKKKKFQTSTERNSFWEELLYNCLEAKCREKPWKSQGSNHAAPIRLANRKHCALSTQPNPHPQNRWFIGEFWAQADQSTQETAKDVEMDMQRNIGFWAVV